MREVKSLLVSAFKSLGARTGAGNMRKLKKMLTELMADAEKFGLPERDINNAVQYFDYFEYGPCFDTIVEQLFEYNIEIDEHFYELCRSIALKMELPEKDYAYLKELIGNKSGPQGALQRGVNT